MDAEVFAEDLKDVLNNAGGILAENHTPGGALAFGEYDEHQEIEHGLWVCSSPNWNATSPPHPDYDKLILEALKDAGLEAKHCPWSLSSGEIEIIIGRND